MLSSNLPATLYFDYAAATPVAPEYATVYADLLSRTWANPSALHRAGRQARGVLETARRQVASVLNAKSSEIVFLNSATEANNLAWQGISGGVLSSVIEHASLQSGYGDRVVRIEPDSRGIIDVVEVEEKLKEDTRLVSLIWVQNELGSVQPVLETGALLKTINEERTRLGLQRVYFHVDAVQAPNYYSLDVDKLGVDLLTLSAQKIYAPRGSAVLYVRTGTSLRPLLQGGGQEKGLWSGTPNVAAHALLAKALETTQNNLDDQNAHARALQDRLETWAVKTPGVRLNSHHTWTAPGHVHLSFAGLSQEEVLTYLDLHGVLASAGSSCASGAAKDSDLIRYLQLPPNYTAHLRLTYGRYTTSTAVEKLFVVLERLRHLAKNFEGRS